MSRACNTEQTKSFLASITLLAAIVFVLIGPAPIAAVAQGENSSDRANVPLSSSSSGLQFSSQPIWEENATSTGVSIINQTHTRVDFIGNGTMTVLDTGETINMTNTGYGIITGRETVFAYGREHIHSEEDGDTTAITFYEIIRYDPATLQGKGIVIAAFDSNATGTLAPFNGMTVAGVHEENPDSKVATITLWKWESGIIGSNNNTATATTIASVAAAPSSPIMHEELPAR
ncbi:hypothetical protein NTE_00177 [Candidatus Nitrososphaera evergladensis SR1]|uniref:Uncharacterized protein n=1 Tax=Candidatus Nitrososphaera evergladensis SR1 TaxID=1459636 RepID=A0A075MSD9_9ARCH|nr:hypothetical protein NTE_00177 [Candidatus Nitrososphaera evergladensis SR1]